MQKNWNKFVWTIIMCFMFCVFSLINAQNVENDTVTYLNNVTVTARAKQEVLAAQQLGGNELENINSISVAEAVRFFSGVQMKDYGGIGGLKTVNIRGMGSEHTGVFFDGIEIGNAQNGIVDLGRFSLENMEQISLFNAQRTRIFQSAKEFASSGSIYLTTKKPIFSENKRTNMGAKMAVGSFGVVNPSMWVEQKFSESINASFSAEYLNANGRYKFRGTQKNAAGEVFWDTIGVRKNGKINALRIETTVFGETKKGKWNVKEYFYDSWRQIPGAFIKNGDRHEQQRDRNFFLQTSVEQHFTERYKLLVSAKFAADYMRYYNQDVHSRLFDNHYLQREFYISTASQYTVFPFLDINLSLDYQYNTLNSNLKNFVFPRRNTEFAVLAAYFHCERLKIQTNALATLIQETIENQSNNNRTSPNKKNISPAIFLNYQLFDNQDLNLRAFYKRIFRMPTFNELYYNEVGNPNLKPETGTQYNLGVDIYQYFNNKTLKKLNISVDCYYNFVENKIVAIPRSAMQWTMLNIGKARIFGADLNVKNSWNLTKEILLNTSLSYTYSHQQNLTSRKLNYGKQIPYAPFHSGSFWANVAYKTWDFNCNLLYSGLRYSTEANVPQYMLDAWLTTDISVVKSLNISKIKTKIGLELNNIFNRYYDVIQQYPMPARNGRFYVKINL